MDRNNLSHSMLERSRLMDLHSPPSNNRRSEHSSQQPDSPLRSRNSVRIQHPTSHRTATDSMRWLASSNQ